MFERKRNFWLCSKREYFAIVLCCVCFGRVYYYASVTDTEKKHANENDKIVIAIMVVVDSSICVRESHHSSS